MKFKERGGRGNMGTQPSRPGKKSVAGSGGIRFDTRAGRKRIISHMDGKMPVGNCRRNRVSKEHARNVDPIANSDAKKKRRFGGCWPNSFP